MLRPFRLHRPTSLAEATATLAALGEGAHAYAGGVNLLLRLRGGEVVATHLVDVKRVPELQALGEDGGRVVLGAALTHRRLETAPLVRERLPVLARAEALLANPRVRNQGTLGGNLYATPHADTATALLLHDAELVVVGPRGERRLALEALWPAEGPPALAAGELIAAVTAAPLPAALGHAYLRIERLNQPTVNVAVGAASAEGRLTAVRLAAACNGAPARRLRAIEAGLVGVPVAEVPRWLRAARPALRAALRPPDDLVGSSAYKLHLVSVLLGRALAEATGEDGRR